MTAQVYQQLLDWGILLAKSGQTVILDAKYDRHELRHAVITACNDHQIPLQIVYCFAPIEVLKKRLHDRQLANNDIADATVDLLNQQLAEFEELTPAETEYLYPQTVLPLT
jgi:predicted kinase